MRSKLFVGLISIMLLVSFSACQGSETKASKGVDDAAAEETLDNNGSVDSVSPEFDEKGNPTGDYAKYLWEEEQKREAMDAIAEEAQREMMEDAYEQEPNGFPF